MLPTLGDGSSSLGQKSPAALGRDPCPDLQAPRHVAIIMDGNGRWAMDRGLPRNEGHRAGVGCLRSILQRIGEYRVEYVTIYAFSTENWTRPSTEVDGIMNILRAVIEEETRALHQQGVRIVHLGRTDRMAQDLKKAVSQAQDLTQNNKGMTLCVAFDYGGRGEILDAVKALIEDGVAPQALNEEIFARYLYTQGVPDPDLIIRTGGEQRISNFLLWQSAYSEFYSTSTPWPDLGPKDIDEAFQAYHNRKRRFGAVSPED